MALQVTCRVEGPGTRVQVRQSGRGMGERWERYYSVIESGWVTSLQSLKAYIETAPKRVVPPATSAVDRKPMARIEELPTTSRAVKHARRRS